jgi:leader peptidase (prepilin peptidase)/N-methyltransferase
MVSLAWLWPILAAPFVGSFLGVLVTRLPQDKGFILSRSCCDACAHPLNPGDLIPIISFVALRGRCRYCASTLSWLYPAIELAAMLVATWTALTTSGWMLWESCVLGWTMLALALIDSRDGILPDVLTLPLLILGLVIGYLSAPTELVDRAIGAALGYFLVIALRWLYLRWRRREGIGLGDAKLLAAAGAWVGLSGLPSVLLIGSLLALAGALILACRGRRLTVTLSVPFGPALCAAFWVVWLYGPLA